MKDPDDKYKNYKFTVQIDGMFPHPTALLVFGRGIGPRMVGMEGREHRA